MEEESRPASTDEYIPASIEEPPAPLNLEEINPTTLEVSVPAPNELSASLKDAFRAELERVPRVEVTPGAIRSIKGQVVPLVEEKIFLDAGDTLVDGSGRVWNRSGLIEPGRDKDGRPILYPADLVALKRRAARADIQPSLLKVESSEENTPTTSQAPSIDSSPVPTPKLSTQRRRLVRASSREMREIERSARKNGRRTQQQIDEVAEEDENDDILEDDEADDEYADSMQEIEDRLDDLNELAEETGLGDMEMAEEEELNDKLEQAEAGIGVDAREHRIDARRRREEIEREDRMHREKEIGSGATTPF